MLQLFGYTLEKFGLSFWGFLEHWYLDGFRFAWRKLIRGFEEMEKIIALKITFRNFFQPLYQDKSVVGFVMGVWWRGLRLIFGTVIYFVFFLAFMAIYAIWLIIPPYLIFKILEPWL